jgi:hypothetical protein
VGLSCPGHNGARSATVFGVCLSRTASAGRSGTLRSLHLHQLSMTCSPPCSGFWFFFLLLGSSVSLRYARFQLWRSLEGCGRWRADWRLEHRLAEVSTGVGYEVPIGNVLPRA